MFKQRFILMAMLLSSSTVFAGDTGTGTCPSVSEVKIFLPANPRHSPTVDHSCANRGVNETLNFKITPGGGHIFIVFLDKTPFGNNYVLRANRTYVVTQQGEFPYIVIDTLTGERKPYDPVIVVDR